MQFRSQCDIPIPNSELLMGTEFLLCLFLVITALSMRENQMVKLCCVLYIIFLLLSQSHMIYILQFAFKGTFVSFDGVHGMAQNTFCITDLAIKNCGSESNILI